MSYTDRDLQTGKLDYFYIEAASSVSVKGKNMICLLCCFLCDSEWLIIEQLRSAR